MFYMGEFNDIFNIDEELFNVDEIVLQTCKNRKILEVLFIDRIMKIIGIDKPHRLFPPKHTDGLKKLHTAVVETKGTDHHKLSVFYYILLEFDRLTNGDNFSKNFVQKFFLPKKYQILIKGLWYMDHLEFNIALQYLAHPSLIPSFPDEILEVLVKASKNNLNLPIAYYYSVQPVLNTKRTMNSLFSAIARSSVTEAFYFIRKQNEYSQQYTFQMLIHLVLSDNSSDAMAERCLELVSLPFTPQEEDCFEDYLLRGEGKALKGAKDTVIMRYIGTGQFSKFLSVKDIKQSSINGISWDIISDFVTAGLRKQTAS